MRVPLVSLVVLVSLLSFASVLASPRGAPAAQTACPSGTCKTYLSLMTVSTAPQLNSPADGFASSALAFNLSWTPVTVGKHQIQISSDPLFLDIDRIAVDTTKTVRQPIPAQMDTLITSNLKGSTLYYWRVGAPSTQGYIYSPVRTFTTPPKTAGTLPIATNILAPKNNTSIKGTTVKLQWQSITGATAYRIRMYDANGKSVSDGTEELGGTANALVVEDLPLGTYKWKVKCLNGFGWGEYSEEFVFTLY
ncbi:MAG TPA: hypothetical protein VFU22_17805 [Roseiflexaceae bacterium]|nr:hypothetical protein [Roseiflexaceae bacterium]